MGEEGEEEDDPEKYMEELQNLDEDQLRQLLEYQQQQMLHAQAMDEQENEHDEDDEEGQEEYGQEQD